MRERDIEKRLVCKIREMGGEVYKWVSPGNSGVPDRIVMLPGGRVIFVELKTDGGSPSPIQREQMRKIRRTGCRVELIRGMDELEEFLDEVRTT